MLITGSEGFIGKALHKKTQGYGFDLVHGEDIRDFNQIDYFLSGVGAKPITVVNLAAISGVMDCYNNPLEAVETNVKGAVNVLEAARRNGVGKVILASSGAANGAGNPYAASKMAMETFGVSYQMAYGLSVCSMRFTNVYGPGSVDKSSCVAQFCKQALTTGRIIINGDGEQTRDFVYIDDVVDAIKTIAETPAVMTPPVVQVCGGNQISINKIAEIITRTLKAEIVHTDPRVGDVRANSVTNDFHILRGNTKIEEGIEKTVEYFKSIKDQLGIKAAS